VTQSTKIIENGFVFTGDRQNRSGQITLLVQKGLIVDTSKPAPVLKSLYPSAEVIDAKGKVILPGFVDAHHTGVSSILQYLTSGLPMSKWNKTPSINRALDYLQKEASYDEFLKIFRLSYYAALKSGVTTIAEFGFDNPEHSFAAALEAMQQTSLKGFIGLHNGDQIDAARLARSPNIRFATVIADEENLTTYNLQSTIRTAQEFQRPIILHLGQTRRASDTIKKNFNKSIAQLYSDYKVFDYPVHLLHLACYEAGDLDIITKFKIPLVLSPSAILQKGTELPQFEELLKGKIPIALGSDWGLARPIENIQTYCSILKTLGLQTDRAFELLSLQTQTGARALGLNSEIGTIEVGKKADIVFINAADFKLNAVFANENSERILDLILQNASSQNINDVMINGEFYVREGHILTYSEEELAADAESLLRKFLNFGEQKTKVSQSATILQLPTNRQGEKSLTENEIPFDEGFRVVNKEAKQKTSREPSEDLPNPSNNLHLNVRKIFGEDDV
jgi:5-methylthioadenosine/S-adenosylhomocysteine deaminase